MNLIGKASPYGTLATTAQWTGVISSINKVNGHDFSDNWDTADLKDGHGNIFGRAGANRQHTLSLQVFFYDPSTPSTENAARANTILPPMFDPVTIAGSLIAFMDGTWNYMGGSYTGRSGNYHEFTMNIWRGGAGASPASLPAAT